MYEGVLSVSTSAGSTTTPPSCVAEEAVWVRQAPGAPAWIMAGQLIEAARSGKGSRGTAGYRRHRSVNGQRRYFRDSYVRRPSVPTVRRCWCGTSSESGAGRTSRSSTRSRRCWSGHRSTDLAVALLVDAGGVGVAVLDLMRQRGLRPSVDHGDGRRHRERAGAAASIRCPKRELVECGPDHAGPGAAQDRGGLADAPTLTQELQDYQVKIQRAATTATRLARASTTISSTRRRSCAGSGTGTACTTTTPSPQPNDHSLSQLARRGAPYPAGNFARRKDRRAGPPSGMLAPSWSSSEWRTYCLVAAPLDRPPSGSG